MQRWILVAIGVAAVGVHIPSFAANAVVRRDRLGAGTSSPSPGCHDEQGLTYLCDLVVPEDILTVGSTGMLLASGHRAPGHLYLIDPAARTQSELIHGATFRLQRDTRAYP